ncbi:MAG: PQQ-binding-like beta-propeller repeat protein [Planctomycetaceae bacterium]
MRNLPLCIIAFSLSVATVAADDSAALRAGNWHQWRGPNADGVAPLGDPPVTWDETTNVKWKVGIPGKGTATPIIWRNKVFVLTAVTTDKVDESKTPPDKQPRRPFGIRYPNAYYRFIVMCLDRGTGKVLWRRTAREAVPPEGRHPDNNYASASPTTDGKYLYASFGSNGVYCYDLDGKKIWEQDLGDMKTRLSFGGGSSPVIHGDSLVVNWDHDGPSFIAVLDAKTGRVRWKKPRDEVSAWATPLVVEHKGVTQVITNASKRVRSYDLKTGKLLWECGGQVFNVSPSPVVKEGVVYCMSGYRGSAAYALPLDATGDITGSDKILWSLKRDTPYLSSPLLYGDLLYFTKSLGGILSVAEAKTGKIVVRPTRLPGFGRVYASPAAAAGRIYLQSRGGRTLVLKHGRKFEVLSSNTIDDYTDASPAIAGNQIFLRGAKSLYCIEKPSGK